MELHSYSTETSARQWVLRLGIIQFVVALTLLLLFSRCTTGGQDKTKATPEIAAGSSTGDTSSQVFLVDTDYVHIAGHHPEQVKATLKTLEGKNFEKGTLGHQLLDYLKRGENDLGVEFKFIDLQFVGRTAELNPKFDHELMDLFDVMTAFPNLKIKIMAYTDNVGSDKENEKLSENRVTHIKESLIQKGLTTDRIEAFGYGEKFPVGDNNTMEGRLIDNRVELMVTQK